MLKRGKDPAKLELAFTYLANDEPMPVHYKDHALNGDWIGYRNCHIENDWILIYKIIESELILVATRTGTHSDFGW